MNPRPETFNTSVYMLILNFRCLCREYGSGKRFTQIFCRYSLSLYRHGGVAILLSRRPNRIHRKESAGRKPP